MNLSCSGKMIKYLMFAFNLFFVISGIIIIAVGAAVKTVYTEYAQFLDGKYFSLPNMLIVTGVFIFVISFFGCCGAIKESWIMLGVFSLLLCLIFVFEFASGIAGYVLKGKTAAYLDDTLRANLELYNETHDVWDLIQETFECCGVDSYTDWQGHLNGNYTLPLSCCPRVSGVVTGAFYCNSYNPAISTTTVSTPTTIDNITSTTNPTTPGNTTSPPEGGDVIIDPITNITIVNNRRKRALEDNNNANVTTTPNPSTSAPYSRGCKQAFGDYVKKHAVQIGGCALGLAIVQIIGIAFSIHLVRQLKNGYYST